MEELLRARLESDAAILALCPVDSINWDDRVGLPAIVLQLINEGGSPTHEGDAGYGSDLVQIDCWAATQTAARDLGKAVRARLDGWGEGDIQAVLFEAGRRTSERDSAAPANGAPANFYRQGLDFQVQHAT